MIPKIIHYIWLGSSPLPDELSKCIDSWLRYMPDYQIMKWDNSVVERIGMTFVNEAIQAGRWAFASDVIRLWVLFQYGGIYLDTDVKVFKSFDPLLNNHAFIGRENCLQLGRNKTEYHLTSFCFGAEKGSVYIKRCLDYYKNRHFITSSDESLPLELRMDVRNASYLHCEIAKLFGYDSRALASSMQKCRDDILTIYPSTMFVLPITESTYCTHLSLGSWRDKPQFEENYTFSYKIKWRLRRVIEKILRRFDYILIKLH